MTTLKTKPKAKSKAKPSGHAGMSEGAKAAIARLLRGLSPGERDRFRKILYRVLPLRQDPAARAYAKELIRFAYRGVLRERRTTLGLRSVNGGRRK